MSLPNSLNRAWRIWKNDRIVIFMCNTVQFNKIMSLHSDVSMRTQTYKLLLTCIYLFFIQQRTWHKDHVTGLSFKLWFQFPNGRPPSTGCVHANKVSEQPPRLQWTSKKKKKAQLGPGLKMITDVHMTSHTELSTCGVVKPRLWLFVVAMFVCFWSQRRPYLDEKEEPWRIEGVDLTAPSGAPSGHLRNCSCPALLHCLHLSAPEASACSVLISCYMSTEPDIFFSNNFFYNSWCFSPKRFVTDPGCVCLILIIWPSNRTIIRN